MNIRSALAFALSFVLATAHADEGDKILMIGNSYTQGVRGTLTALYKNSPKKDAKFAFVHPGGCTLEKHLKLDKTRQAIEAGSAEIIILQDQSQFPAIFPDRTANAAAKLTELAQKHGSPSVFLYQTWGRRDGDPRNGFDDFLSMQRALSKGYEKAATVTKSQIIPVGSAWQQVYQSDKELFKKLYRKDGSHPSKFGAYLTAVTIYCKLNQVSPDSITFTAKLPAEDARKLRAAAGRALKN